jgi:hypothetical protein
LFNVFFKVSFKILNNHGVETIYTDKPLGDKFYQAHQYNPYLIFPTIKNPKQKYNI